MHSLTIKKRKFASLFLIATIGLFLIALTGCGGGGGGTSQSSKELPISGLAQKGSFVNGEIKVQNINSKAKLIGKSTTAKIESKGAYNLKVEATALLQFFASGKFFNEYSGKISSENADLFALIDPDTNKNALKVNLNLFTTLEYKRIIVLMQKGYSYDKAKAEAMKNLHDTFGIAKDTPLTKLNIYDLKGSLKEANANLLLFSAALLKTLESLEGSANGKLVRKVASKMSYRRAIEELYRDFEEDGDIDGEFEGTYEEIRSTDHTELVEAIGEHTDIERADIEEITLPDWLRFSSLNIDSARLKSVTLDGIEKNYSDEEALFIALASNNAKIKLEFIYDVKKDESPDTTASVYAVTGSSVAERIRLAGSSTIKSRIDNHSVFTYRAEFDADVNNNLRVFLKNAYEENKEVTFELRVGTHTKTIENLPIFAENSVYMSPHTGILAELYKGTCDGTTDYAYAKMTIAGRVFGNKDVSYIDVCVQLTYDDTKKQFIASLHSGKGDITDDIYLKLGNNDIIVEAPHIYKDHLEVSNVTLDLPDEHSIHSLSTDGVRINPYGVNKIELDNPTGNKIATSKINEDNEISDLTFSGKLKDRYLHAKNLPFMFALDEYTLTEDALVFSNAHVKYVFNYANEHINNTERFSNPSSDPIDVYLSNAGVKVANIAFNNVEELNSHFPRATTKSGSFVVKVKDSNLQIVSNTKDETIVLDYDKGCKASGCPDSTSTGKLNLEDISSTSIYSNGSVVSKQTSTIGVVAWGSNGTKEIFTREDEGAQVYIPGYEIPTTKASEVASYLLGTLEEKNDNTMQQHKVDDATAIKGHYLFAGANIGKLIIESAEIDSADGVSLSGKEMGVIIGDASEAKKLTSNAYSKYYVRASGVTGVFNRNPDAFTANVYGYNMDFSQFAFRQVSNKIDEHSMIDGSIKVPGKGQFDVAFTSLGLDCRGGLNDGVVTPCDTSSEEQVNCNETLNAWKIATTFTNIGFEGDGTCAVTKELAIGHILDIAALKDKIGLTTVWSPEGMPAEDSKVTGSAYNQMDGDRSKNTEISNGGYDIAFGDTIKLASQDSQDWFEANVKFGLPFWDEADMSIRLSNKTTSEREPSVVVKDGELHSKFDMSQTNNTIAKAIPSSDYNQTATYSWAGGIIEIGLPVYYDPFTLDENTQIPKFLGRKYSVDLKVMSANAGIDYISPESTSMSFGASADFEALGRMKLHIDLNDPNSLKDIDNVLVDTLHIFDRNSEGEGPFERTIGEVVSNIKIGNKLLGQGMTLSMEKVAIMALEAAGKDNEDDPFEKIAQLIAKVHAVPALINDRVKTEISAKTTDIIGSAFDNINDAFKDIDPVTYKEFANEHNDTIQSAIATLNTVLDSASEYNTTVKFLEDINESLAVIDNVTEYVTEANDTLNSYFVAEDGTCSWEYTAHNGFFKPVGDVTDAIKDVNTKLQELQISKIEDIANTVNSYTGLNSKDLVALAEKIKNLSESLNTMVNSNTGAFETKFNLYICDNLAEIQSVMSQILDRTNKLKDIVDKLKIEDTLVAMQEGGEIKIAFDRTYKMAESLRDDLSSMYENDEESVNDALLTAFITNALTVAGVEYEGTPNMDTLKEAAIDEANNALEAYVFAKTDEMTEDLEALVPNLSASDLRALVVTKLFETDGVKSLNLELQKMLQPIADEVDKIAMSLLGGLDRSLNKLLANVSDKINETVNQATSSFTNAIPVKAAKMDGYAIIQGDSLAQAHIGSEFEVKGASEKTSFSLNAALDIWNNEALGSAGCSGDDSSSNLNVQISTRDISMPLGVTELSVDLVLLGITLGDGGLPVGIFGAITSKSGMDFEAMALYNLGLAVGIGETETYLGAKGNAKLDDVQLGVAFLVGHICNPTVRDEFIPEEIKDFITIPDSGFTGALVFGEAQVPVWKNGCALTVNVRAKVGVWYLIAEGAADVYGGLVGGGAFGKGLCIASLGGELLALAEKSGDRVRFQGSGWGAAGVGSCDNSWSSVSDSRDDDWCGTGDAQFGARYDNGWELLEIEFSAVH